MFWKNFKIRQKLFVGFGIVILIMLSVISYSYISFIQEDKALEESMIAHEIAGHADNVLINLLKMETGSRGYALTGRSEFLEPYNEGKLNYEQHFDAIKTLTLQSPQQQERLINLNERYKKWMEWQSENLIVGRKMVLQGDKSMESLIALAQGGKGKADMDMIRSTLSEIVKEEQFQLAQINAKLVRLKTQTGWVMSGGGIIAAIMAILITVIMTRIIVTPVKALTDTLKDISEGEANFDVRLKVDSNDEIGQMATSFNVFMDNIKEVIIENNNESWMKTGEAELNKQFRGVQDVKELVTKVITYITKHSGGQIGAIYIKENNDSFKLLGSYAYKKRKKVSNIVQIGEGFVGQCAFEKQSIIVSNIPEDYISISSGLGEAVPKSILVVPCVYNDEIEAIIEIGAFHQMTDLQLNFIERISYSLAIAIHSLDARIKTQELLDKTLEQSEELQVKQEELQRSNEGLEQQAKILTDSEAKLQAQQEELRQSNEELEEQAKALIESEARLQAQQEELRVINEELEEHTKSLERQKNDIIIKNENLLSAQAEIEEKAKAIEITSKYKSEFLANMSHEFRTPLNSILVLSQMLAEKKASNRLSDKQLEYATTIHSSGKDLLKLINDILDLSKVEAGKMDVNLEQINLAEFSQYVEGSFKHVAFQKGINLNIVLDHDIPKYITSDSLRVQQIVNNLLSNALKFTEKGEVIFRIHRHKQENVVGMSITDTGIGIPKEKQHVIFDAFKQSDGTTSRKYGGTGLGLSISKELANLLGGEIYLVSEENQGSTFTLALPQQYNVVEGSRMFEAPIKNSIIGENIEVDMETNNKDDRKGITEEDKSLLIIEDDSDFSHILYELAHDKGYKALIAHSAQSGIRLAKAYIPDAILLDIGLPDMSGWKVIEQLQKDKTTKDIPVHVVSGKEDESAKEKSIVSYIKKPVSLEQLNEVFAGIEELKSKEFKKLLVLDDNKEDHQIITELLGGKEIQVTCLDSGEEACEILKKEIFDCIIMDLTLKDMKTIDFLKKRSDGNVANIPVIIHTEKILTQEEEVELNKYTKSIVIKGAKSTDRLVAEANLFLHNIGVKKEDANFKLIKSNQEKEQSLNNKKILVVDDDMRNVFALSSLLEEKGIKVIIGKNGEEAIKKVKENPDIDLILMDIMMPIMDGYAAMNEIRNTLKLTDMPIIALTAKAMKDDRQKAIEAGANDYLTKPLDVKKLISLLRVWLYK